MQTKRDVIWPLFCDRLAGGSVSRAEAHTMGPRRDVCTAGAAFSMRFSFQSLHNVYA